MRHRTKAAVVAALLAGCPLTSVHAAESWDWVIAPYLWGASVSTDLREDQPPVGGETSFADVINKLDFAFQGHVEGQGDRFGMFADVTYIALSDDHDYGGSALSTHTSMNTTLVELAGTWNVDPARYDGLDVFVGLRHTVASGDAKFVPDNPALATVQVEIDQSYTDAMIGARYTARLSDAWSGILRVDGSWGDTEGAVNLSALLTRKFSRGSLVFGYRYMDTELKEAGRDIDLTAAGPVVSFAFGL